MTLAEFQPYVEQALTAVEWETARARWRQGLLDDQEAITKALPLAGQYGIEAEPLQARLALIAVELQIGDVTADQVSASPIRSVPMDLITAAVIRRLLKLPAEFPVLSVKTIPDEASIRRAVTDLAGKWTSPNGPTVEPVYFVEPPH